MKTIIAITLSLIYGVIIGFCASNGWTEYKILHTAEAIKYGVNAGLRSNQIYKNCDTVECEIDAYIKVCEEATKEFVHRNHSAQ